MACTEMLLPDLFAVAYRFLTTRDVDGDMVEDIVFALQTADDDSTSIRVVNTTCANEGQGLE